jgi:acyl-CoA thioester hydrolase
MQERRIPIRWRDVDNYGHVNNAVYLTYLEECRDAWAREVAGTGFDFVIVRIAIDFRSELSLEDREVIVRCWGEGVGSSSIRTHEEVLAADGRLSAEASSVIVHHDVELRTSVPLTDEQRVTIQAAVDADLAARGSGAPR